MAIFGKHSPDGTPRRHAWDSALASERKTVLKMMLIALGLTTALIWTILALYFGAYYRQEQNAYRLTVRILDMDSQYASTVAGAPAAILGPAVVEAAQQNRQSMPHYHLGWQIADSSELQNLRVQQGGQGINASDYASQLVLNQDVWAVILINPNATVLATEAATTGNAAYDPRGAISFFYEEARNFYATNQYISLLGLQTIESAIAQASRQFVSQFTGSADALATALAGNALTYPFGYSQFNLRPFDQLAAEATTTAGAIYLIIFTFFISPVWKKAFEPLRRKLTMKSMLALNWAVPIIAYFWLSLNYSLVTLAYQTDFTRKYGYGGFPLFWAMNWITMSGLGMVMEGALRLLGPLLFPVFLAMWVIVQVSVAFVSISDMDPFYSYGFAFPVWNNVDATKSIIFGTKNHLTQNFIVNLGWVIGGSIALLFICWYQRRQEDKQELQQRIEEKKEHKQEKPSGKTAA